MNQTYKTLLRVLEDLNRELDSSYTPDYQLGLEVSIQTVQRYIDGVQGGSDASTPN